MNFFLKRFLHSPLQVAPTLRLRLHKPKAEKKVQWTETTVDNEHMDKKKSKCCCVYVKPKVFGESSSESEDECDHCSHHVELKKKSHKPPDKSHDDENPPLADQPGSSS